MVWTRRAAFTGALVAGLLGVGAASAFADVTPGWECVPTTAGQAVVSGGTAGAPNCGSGTTAVLAPTYVSAGVGGKPTVQFSAVNVQVVSGSGTTSGAVNGKGNLIVGYAENANNHKQTGSNDLVVGLDNGWSGYGDLVAGDNDQVTGPYASVLGLGNVASGSGALAAGHDNKASGSESSVTGGEYNLATDSWASIAGGCDNIAGPGPVPTGPCSNQAESILGGTSNDAFGLGSTISGGQSNTASGAITSVLGGLSNAADGLEATISGGYGNTAGGNEASITGGGENTTTGDVASVLGGYYNTATTDEAVVVGGCSNVAGPGNVGVNPGCTDTRDYGLAFQTVLGGIGNNAASEDSTISGGDLNSASGSAFADAIAGGGSESLTSATNYTSRIGATTENP